MKNKTTDEHEAKKGKTSVTINLDFKNLKKCFIEYGGCGRVATKIELIKLLVELDEQQNNEIMELWNCQIIR